MDDLQPDDPARIGPFRLVARLGAGGMGQVYLGRDIGGRQAAVKVVHPGHAADPEFRDRFAREIATARSVDSPWTAAVLAADPHAPQPWLATEYVAGPDLAAAVAASGPLPEDAATALAGRLAQALAHLHAAGVVHRDLKPSNVLLSADGPRLIDFGIARAVDATRITRTGVVVGTPAFMSPEQALGQETGPPSDVFSLAAVITFAATGTGPFGRSTGNPVVMLRKVSAGEPDLGAVPAGLREAIAPCLAKDPAARPGAEQLASRLAELDPGTARDGQRIFGIGGHEAPVLEIADLATGGTRQIPLPARTDSVAVTPDGERVFVPGDPDADQPTPVHVLDIATGASRPLPGTERMRHVALSPDGRTLYAIGPAEAVEVDVTSGAVVRRLPLGTFGNAFAVSPGGARFYTLGTSDPQVQVLDLDKGGLGATVPIAHPYLNELALAPDGSTLYVTSEAGLTVVPIEGGGG